MDTDNRLSQILQHEAQRACSVRHCIRPMEDHECVEQGVIEFDFSRNPYPV